MRASIAKWLGRGSKRISRTGLYEFLDGELARIPEGARVLSVGAGGEINERIEQSAAARRFDVVQLDIDAAREPDVVGDICSWRPDRPFDAVIAAEVFEHVPEPARAVDNIRQMLVTGGRLIASTPFMFPIHDAPNDYYRYTRHGLEHLLRAYREVAVEPRSTWPEVFGVLAVRMARERRHRISELVVVPTVLALTPLLRATGRLLPNEAITSGYNIVAVA